MARGGHRMTRTLTIGSSRNAVAVCVVLALAACGGPSAQGQQPQTSAASQGLDRTVLPIREPIYPRVTELDVRNVKAPARFQVKAPDGAPNVLVILLDDMGFGMSSAFGGPIHMPTVDRLAA